MTEKKMEMGFPRVPHPSLHGVMKQRVRGFGVRPRAVSSELPLSPAPAKLASP
jgi:hypothetical protein